MAAKLRVTLVRSPISHTARTRGSLRALGLRRLGDAVEVADNPQMRGIVRAVRFLVVTEEVAPAADEAKPRRARATKEEGKE
jgi:large subunit ribosomal protein L30